MARRGRGEGHGWGKICWVVLPYRLWTLSAPRGSSKVFFFAPAFLAPFFFFGMMHFAALRLTTARLGHHTFTTKPNMVASYHSLNLNPSHRQPSQAG